MKKAVITLVALVVAAGGVVLCVWLMSPKQTVTTPAPDNQSGPSISTPTTEPATGEVTVRMKNSSFNPVTVTVKKGTKVTWVNDDSLQHNVVASDADNTGGLPTQNSLLSKGGSYSFTFETAGIFDYHCTPHPFMTGTVVVE